MRFNAIIAATILAATVSGAAIANPAPQPTEVASNTDDLFDLPEGSYFVEEGDESLTKRDAKKVWVWTPPYRPIGLPVGKRDAEAAPEAEPEAGNWVWTPPYRPIGLPVGKRDAQQ